MNAHYAKIGFAGLLSLVAAFANAADTDAGKAKAAACQGCHGAAGVSNNPQWPNLAGQTSLYLAAQLKKFKSGARENPTMKALAAELNDADIQNLAAYFASLPVKSAEGDTELAKAGKDKTAACMGCHGQKLLGAGQFPRLAGQHPQYLTKQMNDFKSGAREAGAMNAIAKTLSDDDIKAVSAYLGSLKD
ncbi:MAG: c-type cytochrome [Methylomonas sp.]